MSTNKTLPFQPFQFSLYFSHIPNKGAKLELSEIDLQELGKKYPSKWPVYVKQRTFVPTHRNARATGTVYVWDGKAVSEVSIERYTDPMWRLHYTWKWAIVVLARDN